MIAIGGLIVMCTVASASAKSGVKTGPTFYTPSRIKAARENLEKYDWAKVIQRRIMKGEGFWYYIGPEYGPAETYVEQSDDFMWLLQPTTKIGRVVPLESKAIDPEQGKEAQKIHVWCPYTIDPINKPYKVRSMLTKKWYPSNDYHLGDMTSGDFPDDGEGFVCKDGVTFYALREYAHMVYGSAVIPALRSLSQAYLITSDKRYARKGAILLARLASVYPNGIDRKDGLYFSQYGGRSPQYSWKTGGRISDLIWETFLSEEAILAYDALFDYLGEDEELINFLKAKGMPIENADDLRRYIEKYLIGSVMEGLIDGSIHGNEGFHQATAMTCALVLDRYEGDEPNSQTMVNWAYLGNGRSAYMLDNGLTRDGGGHESPGYNKIKLDFIKVNRLMEEIRLRQPERFSADRYPDLFAGDKPRRLFDYFIDIVTSNTHMPSIGDSGGIHKVRRHAFWQYSYLTGENVFAFNRYGDPRYARAATNAKGQVFAGELFEHYPAKRIEEALADPASIITRQSRLLDGYGVGVLESGAPEYGRAAVLNYTSLVSHRQRDNLTLELVVRGVDLLPDLGYPKTWTYTNQFDQNSWTHNTVTVDETQPAWSYGGICRLFASTNGVHVITASHDPYRLGSVPLGKTDAKQCDLYERTVVMVDLDDERFYLIDLFVVNGGEQHDQSWHAMLNEVVLPDLDWQTQETGTLAGPDVQMFSKWTDKWGRKRDDAPSFVAHVKRAALKQTEIWTWPTGLPESDELRLHMVPLGGAAQIIQGKAKSPVRPDDWWLDYTFVRHQVDNGSASQFLTLIDAPQGEPIIKEVRVVSESPLIIEVDHATGTDRIYLQVPLTSSSHTRHRALGVRVESQGRDVRIGTLVRAGGGYFHSSISDLDYAKHQITIEDDPALVKGTAIRIFNDGRTAMYQVKDVKRQDGQCTLTLDATALLGRGPVAAIHDGRLDLDTNLIFATGRFDSDGALVPGVDPHAPDNQLAPGWDRYAGAWVIEGEKAYRLRGATRPQYGPDGGVEPGTKVNALIFEDHVPAAQLTKVFEGKIATIWQYGIGDKIEVARVESVER